MKTLDTMAHKPTAAMERYLMPYINAVIDVRWILMIAADAHVFSSKHPFMHKYNRGELSWCYLHRYIEIGKRVMRGQFRNALVVLSGLLGATSFRQ
ncbi:MAG: hypothetical protein V7459_13595 [Oceanicoccus sp.]